MTQDWLTRAVAMVSEGYCPNDLGAQLDTSGWCDRCRIRYSLGQPNTVIAEWPGDVP